tara:strand:- start:346 stop:1221 length:876 start_codon:yes stop_codon:yes gene_type:complete
LSNHVVGIVPLITEPMDFNLDWHDSLMPIAPNYYAVERAVLECAYAGCKTIWIVANDDTTPLIRHRLGDYIQDPVWLGRMSRFPSSKRTLIPIFYVPNPPEHKNKEFCISWAIIKGASVATEVGGSISKWIKPSAFYVAFPHSIYPPDFVRGHRLDLAKQDNFFLTHQGKSVGTGDMLGFTFNKQQFQDIKNNFLKTENSLLLGQELDNEKEYFKDKFSLDNTFKCVIMYREGEEIPWHYQIDSWNSYCNFLSSEEKNEIRHPGKLIISYRELNPIGVDNANQSNQDNQDD